ncbi:cardiolipin synthetase [Novosphingobium nitrogenifigens DSM 19370]|uniref:Cardiolipin synthase n=1 Tax=Novosphingobium nitrogenifigens DSM 19370 TaxID=983920 RepID=F1Z3Q9_9SPHN|nr:cardiolipin synthase [Novosphingobium nitrogenifigens]EGD60660.1 cardiolipin synthetase [Novosphingobium nitrogenifigens DSM 19370]
MLPAISTPLLLHIALAVVLSLRVLYRRLQVNSALAWIVILIAMPIAGPVLYVLFGDPTLGGRRLHLGQRIRRYYENAYAIAGADGPGLSTIPPPFDALARSIARDSGFPVLSHNRHTILTDAGTILNSMIRDIDAAQSDCCLEFYIIDPSGRVEAVLEAVLRAAARGVSCKILADDYGSKAFFRSPWPARLKTAGVGVLRSLPVALVKSFSKRSDLRNHRKQLICDRTVAYTGSFNLVDPRLFKTDSHVGEWIDIMMRIEGQMVDALACLFNTDYLLDEPGREIGPDTLPPLPFAPQAEWPGGRLMMQLLPSGPEMANSTIYEFIVAAIFSARRRVRIVTPYFIPDQAVLLALKSAAKRGVAVEVIVPEKVDTRIGQYASQASFAELLDAGIVVRCFAGGLLHAKAMLIDESVSLFGTVNMDMRSFYLNLELSLLIYERQVNADLDAVIDRYAHDCTTLTRETWAARSWRRRFLENLFRLAGPLL